MSVVIVSSHEAKRGPKGSTCPGDKFFRLTAVMRLGRDKSKNLVWRFKCDCGNITDAIISHVRNGHKKSCGCYSSEVHSRVSSERVKHGATRNAAPTAEYMIWQGMIARCEYTKHASYKNYGARGIKVVEPFRTSFEAFIKEVGPRPTPKHTIDRIDNDGNYAPGNVRWATRSEQARNKRRNTDQVASC